MKSHRLLVGIAVGSALAVLGPVFEAVGSHSGSHAHPWDPQSGADVQRAAAAMWGNEFDDGHETFKLSVWRRDEAYASAQIYEVSAPSRFVDGAATLVRIRCVDGSGCTEKRMTASLHDRGNRFVAEAATATAQLAATLTGGGKSCSIRVSWTPTTYNGQGVTTSYRGFDAVEITGRADATGEGSCLPLSYPRNRFGQVWERIQRVTRDYTDSAPVAASISTVSGVGSSGFLGDGGPARWAWLFHPNDVAIPKVAGNVLTRDWRYAIADTHNNRIRVIRGESIHTVAGNGTCQGPRAGTPAEVAVCHPASVVFGRDGSLLFSSYWGHVVQRIGPDGLVEVVAGGGTVLGDGVAAHTASLSRPSGLAIDLAGRLYIADEGSNRVRRIDADGKIRTIAGNGTCRASADGLPASETSFCFPSDVAVDSSGIVYVVDEDWPSHRLRRINRDGTVSTVLTRSEIVAAVPSQGLLEPANGLALYGVAVGPGDTIYVSARDRILRVLGSGATYTVAGGTTCDYHGDGGPPQAAGVCLPAGLDVDREGSVVFAESANHVIRRAEVFG